jgi:hypothetical protein
VVNGIRRSVNADNEAMQHVFGDKMDQLLAFAYFLSGQHIEHLVRNAIRYSKPGMEALAVIQVRKHEQDVPAERLDTVFYLPSCDYCQQRDGCGAGLGLAITDRCTEVE